MFLRRLGGNEQSQCESGYHCPQILEMADHDFAVVGTDITDEAIPAMPPGPGVGAKERVIHVPRKVFIAALAEILDDRQGQGATLITSQFPVSQWHELIADATVADAILDRLVHNA
jgi:hypothetical protein